MGPIWKPGGEKWTVWDWAFLEEAMGSVRKYRGKEWMIWTWPSPNPSYLNQFRSDSVFFSIIHLTDHQHRAWWRDRRCPDVRVPSECDPRTLAIRPSSRIRTRPWRDKSQSGEEEAGSTTNTGGGGEVGSWVRMRDDIMTDRAKSEPRTPWIRTCTIVHGGRVVYSRGGNVKIF